MTIYNKKENDVYKRNEVHALYLSKKDPPENPFCFNPLNRNMKLCSSIITKYQKTYAQTHNDSNFKLVGNYLSLFMRYRLIRYFIRISCLIEFFGQFMIGIVKFPTIDKIPQQNSLTSNSSKVLNMQSCKIILHSPPISLYFHLQRSLSEAQI